MADAYDRTLRSRTLPVGRRPQHPSSPLSGSRSLSSSSEPVSPISPRRLAPPIAHANHILDDEADGASFSSASSDLLVAPPRTTAARALPSSLSSSPPATAPPQSPLRLVDTHAFRPSIPPKPFVVAAEQQAGSSVSATPPDRSVNQDPDGIHVPGTGVPRHPRRLWAVRDAQLRSRPGAFPPFAGGGDRDGGVPGVVGAQTATAVYRASPSVVAARIADAFRRWPAAAEYDDDAAVATAVTCDRCWVTVQLWRPPTRHSSVASNDCSVVVECSRVRGSALTFGHLCRTILATARGLDPGDDVRPAHATHVLEMGARWNPPVEEDHWGHRVFTAAVDPSTIAAALERVEGLLQKDRREAQSLGLESLVGLVDPVTSGVWTAVCVARNIVAYPARFHHLWSLIVDGKLGVHHGNGGRGSGPGDSDNGSDSYDDDEADHDGWLRSLALRALANALTALEVHDAHRGTLERHPLSAAVPEIIPALLEDVASGPARPPTVRGRATPHEATYAVRCLRILGVEPPDRDEALRALERARAVGQSSHTFLEREARRCYLQFTEQDRSC